jgi:hypothetical protein
MRRHRAKKKYAGTITAPAMRVQRNEQNLRSHEEEA